MVSDFHWPRRWMMLGLMSAQRSAMALPVQSDLAVTSLGVKPTKRPTMAMALHNMSVMLCDRTLCSQLCS